jgi:hypothetical protein
VARDGEFVKHFLKVLTRHKPYRIRVSTICERLEF